MNETPGETVTVEIRRAMNDHGTLTVEVVDTHETRHVVEFADDLEETLSKLPRGSTIPLRMVPCGNRSNVWRASGFSDSDGDSGRAEPRPAVATR